MCGVCGQEVGKEFDGVIHHQLFDIPNVESLMPAVIHPEHCLLDGKLFEMNGVHTMVDRTKNIDICQECFEELERCRN